MWIPKRVLFEARSLEYQRGVDMHQKFIGLKIPVEVMGKGNRVSGIANHPPARAWNEAKDTLVVRVRDTKKFETCRPSANFQLPLASSCPGKCEYCYLHTTLGKKPYIRVYANLEEILERAQSYIRERLPEDTVFEGAATSDPLPVEPYSGSLADTITFFGRQEKAWFRFVTKFNQVDSLIELKHNGRTRFRFSVNTEKIIAHWEHGTPNLDSRLDALARVAQAGYPMGVIIAPVVLDESWQKDYGRLLNELSNRLQGVEDLTIEIILHRYTDRAKNTILDIFPSSSLPMEKEDRVYKYGQFGYGKWVYPKDIYKLAEEFFRAKISTLLAKAKIEYLV